MGCCVLPGAPSVAGLVEVRRSLWSVLKIEVGTITEGKRRGLLWEQGGDSSPLPLPARSYVRKSHRVPEFRSGRVLEHHLSLPHPPQQEGPEQDRPVVT